MSEPNAFSASNNRCWERFDSKIYTRREHLEQAIIDKLAGAQGDRSPVLSIAGPPGVGKSWVLAQMGELWRRQAFFVFVLNVSQLTDPSQQNGIKHELVRMANDHCIGLDLDSVMLPSFSVLVEHLSRRASAQCPGQRLFVLVDGCDDLSSQDDFDAFQRMYLAPFFPSGAGCFRMAVTRRLDLTNETLRDLATTLQVGMLTSVEAISQCEKHLGRAIGWPNLPTNCAYGWNHPYINCYLLEHKASGLEITLETLVNCCQLLISRSRLENRTGFRSVDEELEELRLLTQKYPQGWTSADFRNTMRRDIDDTYISRSLVSVSGTGPIYRVVDGLHELLQVLPKKELRS